ncbi:MAG TPA: hypothetical protein VGU20_14695 [Stellaceae bacterium]|nr:hypothetical protein [Stellaceae bacterium]
MRAQSHLRSVALPLAARSALQIDYLKLTAWLVGALVPWAAMAALYLGR